MEEPAVILSVGIVGAGIAGLSAAIGLRRAGHQVEVRYTREHIGERHLLSKGPGLRKISIQVRSWRCNRCW